MTAYISSGADRAVLLEGDTAHILRRNAEYEDMRLTSQSIGWIFSGVSPVQTLDTTSQAEARDALEREWKHDRASRLLLILLDPKEYAEVRASACAVLSDFLASTDIQEFLESRLFSRPVTADVWENLPHQSIAQSESVSFFVDRLLKYQDSIRICRNEWDALPADLFESPEARFRIEEKLVNIGAFRELVLAEEGAEEANVSNVVLRGIMEIRDEPNARSILQAWTQGKLKGRSKVLWEQNNETFSSWDNGVGESSIPHDIDRRQVFKNAVSQQNAIIELLERNRADIATRYLNQLIDYQLQTGGAEFVAKSLCKLAQEAKRLGFHDYQLEWAKRAADIFPEDHWAHGQLADAYIYFARYDEALSALDQAERLGDKLFAWNGRARVLKARGRLDEALGAFRKTEAEFEDDPAVVFSWIGHAETLRDMWLFQESLEVYGQAIDRFPDDPAAHCGRAAVLAESGRLNEALDAYNTILRLFPNDPVSLNGRASVWKSMGRLEAALAAYDQTLEVYPNDSIPHCGRADVLRLMGKSQEALNAYRDACNRFPNIPVPYCGAAEVLRDLHEFPLALKEYENVIKRFPFEVRAYNGRANVLKQVGDFEESLAAYDEAVGQFPYDLISQCGRADLLKELGQFEEAISSYDKIIFRHPGYLSAQYSKGAILVAAGRFDEAEALLPSRSPETRDDWIGHHVVGMMLLKKGDVEAAVNHFTIGQMENPFAQERKYYERALATAKLKLADFVGASKLIDKSHDHVAEVLQIHAYGAQGNLEKASNAYAKARHANHPQLVDLREELAERFLREGHQGAHDDAWLFEQECNSALLLAA